MRILNTRYLILDTQKGQSSLEVLIALSIMVLVISAAIIVGFGNQSAVVDTELQSRALQIARQELEDVRVLARDDFALIASSTSEDGIYTKNILVNNLGTYSKEVTAKITWQLSPTQLRDLELTTIITDWRTVWEQSGTGDGGGGLSGDWLNPETAGVFDMGPGNEGTDIAVMEETVFITGEASDPKKPDLFSVDVSNINSPSLVSTIDTGPGLESIALWNTYAYVANDNPNGQLQVIDISNPASMSLIATSSLLSNTELPRTVFAKDGYVYIGTGLAASGPELQIFDVSNPANPSRIATIEIGDHVNDLYVLKDRLYAATSKIDKELIVYDVTSPSSPVEIASYNHPSGTGRSVFVTTYSDAYIGVNDTFVILNTSDLGNISLVDSISVSGSIFDIYVRDDLAFVGSDNANSEFRVINIENPADLFLQSEFNFPQVATGITYRDNIVYVSVRSNNALRIITSTQ